MSSPWTGEWGGAAKNSLRLASTPPSQKSPRPHQNQDMAGRDNIALLAAEPNNLPKPQWQNTPNQKKAADIK